MNRNNNKLSGLLTMCRRAGRLEMGFDPARDAINNKSARLILLACDISAKTEKEVRFYADKEGVPVSRTDIPMEEFALMLGKKAGIITLCDNGFAAKAAELVQPQ